MDLSQPQLGRVLTCDDAFGRGNETRQHVQQRRLARACAARHDDVQPGLHRRVEVLHHRFGCCAGHDELLRRQHLATELSNRQARPVDRHRRDHHVHARPILEPRVTHRFRLVDAPADSGNDPVDHPSQAVLVLEREARELDPSAPLDEDLLGPVDHDLADLGVAQEGLERTKADDLVEEDLDEALLVGRRDQGGRRLGAVVVLGQLHQQAPDAGPVVDVDRRGVPAEQKGVDLALGDGERRAQERGCLVGVQRLRRRWCCGGCAVFEHRDLSGDRLRRRRDRDGRLLIPAVEPL